MQNKKRSEQQNKALHLFFKLLSEELNDAGLYINLVLSKDIEHPWSDKLIKELIWRPVMKSYVGKESTADLNTDDINKIYDVINKHLGEKFLTHVPFPSMETLMEEENKKI